MAGLKCDDGGMSPNKAMHLTARFAVWRATRMPGHAMPYLSPTAARQISCASTPAGGAVSSR